MNPHPVDVYIGQQVKQLRQGKNLRQSDIAEILGVNSSQISRFEHGANAVSASQLVTLAKEFQTPMSSFFPSNPDVSDDDTVDQQILQLLMMVEDEELLQKLCTFIEDVAGVTHQTL